MNSSYRKSNIKKRKVTHNICERYYNIVVEFKDQLKKLREDKGLTQKELGDILFVSRSAIAKYENGNGYPSHETLVRIAEYFNVDINYFEIEKPDRYPLKWKIFTSFIASTLTVATLIFPSILIGRMVSPLFTKEVIPSPIIDKTVKNDEIQISYRYTDNGTARVIYTAAGTSAYNLGKGFENISLPANKVSGDVIKIKHTGQFPDVEFWYDHVYNELKLIYGGEVLEYEYVPISVSKVEAESSEALLDKLNNAYTIDNRYVLTSKYSMTYINLDTYKRDFVYISNIGQSIYGMYVFNPR